MALRISEKKKISPKELDLLFSSIGWKKRGNKKWIEVLKNSSFIISVWDKNKLVGFGRIVTDGVMCMFYDIGVFPTYQNKGIGKTIMSILIKQVKEKKYASIGLFAWKENPNNMSFYKKFGFVKVDTGMELEKYMLRE